MTDIIKINFSVSKDPRDKDSFIRIKEQINNLNRPDNKTVDWAIIEQEAQQLFTEYGFDLQTSIYYTLAKMHRKGLAGFTEGIELLSHLIYGYWDTIWPTQLSVRISLFNWLNARVSPLLHQYTYTFNDLRLLYRIERVLYLIQEKLSQNPVDTRIDIQNSLYFIQEQCKKVEQENTQAISSTNNIEIPIVHHIHRTSSISVSPIIPNTHQKKPEKLNSVDDEIQTNLVEQPQSLESSLGDAEIPVNPPVDPPKVELLKNETPESISHSKKIHYRWLWFLFGGAFVSIVFGMIFFYQKENNENKIQKLQKQVQQYKEHKKAIKNDLLAFNSQLLEAEETRKGITISALKTFIYDMERKLEVDKDE